MEDRGRVRRALWRGSPIELVVEDGFDGAIGPGADLDGPFGGGLEARHAKGADKPDDAETGAIALLRMGPAFEICSQSAAVAGPILRASSRMRSIVQPA
jgi:hypothetical protein